MPHAAKHPPINPRSTAPAASPRVRLFDRILAQAVRFFEEQRPAPLDDRDAVAGIVRDCAEADFESRVVERARRMPEAAQLREALHASANALRLATAAAAMLAVVSGGLAARAALRDNTASVMGLVFGLLGVQTLMLVLWLVALIAGRRVGSGGFLGNAVMGLGRALARLIAPATSRRSNLAAIQAMSLVHGTGAAGRGTLSAISHGLWALFNAGALLVLAALFLGEGYQFRWDSTWLSQESYGALISTLATGPAALGFEVPDAAQIASSRSPTGSLAAATQDAAAREAWSWFFFGSVFTYGLLPRALLLAFSLALRRWSLRRYRLDLDRPGYATLRARLIPDAQTLALAPTTESSTGDHAADQPALRAHEAAAPAGRPPGPPAIVGLEMVAPATGWPPAAPAAFADLGIIDGREAERRILHQLSHTSTSPAPLVVVAELQRSPDRGIERLVTDLVRAAGGDARLILTGGRAMAQHHSPESIAGRASDWRALAQRAGIAPAHVVEMDLDHLTERTRERLQEILNVSPQSHAGSDAANARRLEIAFDEIKRSAEGWQGAPTEGQQTALHLSISRVYGRESRHWGEGFARELVAQLGAGPAFSADAALPALRGAAESIRGLLPPSLAAHSKWLAAGGLAGALGCIAVAGAIAPVVLTALPMWSVVGAALGATLGGLRTRRPAESADATSTIKAADAIHSAVLFALVLELQGHNEASISRILERTLVDLPNLDDASAPVRLEPWLDLARHRFDLAVIDVERGR